jgi:hydrogenase expression/formation protein HypD
MHAILSSPHNRVDGFLAAGHVCAVMGYWEYPPIAEGYEVPIVVTGFEPLDILRGIIMAIKQLENNSFNVENGYSRIVSFEGNIPAQEIINKVFHDCDRKWRGIGLIPNSGWCLRNEFQKYNAESRFGVHDIQPEESKLCISGSILQGMKKPIDCPAFGVECTPSSPLGATMVSSEGACAAYFQYAHDN